MGLLDVLKDTIGIDPGSSNLRILNRGQLVFNQKAQISYDKVDNVISGLGDSIRETNKDVIIRPVNYAIADFHEFEILLRGALKKGLDPISALPNSYRVYYSIPTSSTETEKRAYRDSAEHVGALEVYMIYQSYCSAIAMNLLQEVKDFILIDFGSSKIEISVFSNGVIISEGVVKFGTRKIVQLVTNFLRRQHKLEISHQETENALRSLKKPDEQTEVKIRHTTIAVREIKEVLDNLFLLVNDEILQTIEHVSNHDVVEKITRNGIYFTGGGSTIDFLRERINIDDRIKRTVSQNPLLDTINGLKKVMTDREKYRECLMVWITAPNKGFMAGCGSV